MSSKLHVEIEVDEANLVLLLGKIESLSLSMKVKSLTEVTEESKAEEPPTYIPSSWQLRGACTVHNCPCQCPCQGLKYPAPSMPWPQQWPYPYTVTPWVPPPSTTGTPWTPGAGVTITSSVDGKPFSFSSTGTYTHPASSCSPCAGCGGQTKESLNEAINQALREEGCDDSIYDEADSDLNADWDEDTDLKDDLGWFPDEMHDDLLEKFGVLPDTFLIDDLYGLGLKHSEADDIVDRLQDFAELQDESNADRVRIIKKRSKARRKNRIY